MLNNIAVSKMKKVTRWAGKNPKLSLSLVVLIQIFILFYGLGLGAVLYAHDFYLPLWTLVAMVGVGVIGEFLFRRVNQTYLFVRLRYAGLVLGSLFFAVHTGYNELNPDNYTTVDFMYSYVEQIDASANEEYASISYERVPKEVVREKGGKEKSKYSKRQMRKQQWKKDIKKESNSGVKRFLLVVLGVLCILLALFSVILLCGALCSSSVWGIIGAIFSIILFIVLAVFLFREARNKEAIKEKKAKAESKKEETKWDKDW